MKKTLAALLACSTAHGQLIDDLRIFDASFTGWVDDSRLDEISGMFALRNESNEGKFIVCHDSDSQYMYVIGEDGDVYSQVNLVNKSWRDAEEITGYTDEDGTNYIILCEFGDNPGTRDVKNLFRFVEPETNGDVDISDYDTISYRLPEDVVLERGTNRGDFEGAFACPRDGKIYLFTKRMPTNLIFSLPIQDNYSGILTATYEGEMSAIVSEETGGVISPANCVAACVTKEGDHALIKTYNMVYQFGRPVGATWVEAFQTVSPSIVSAYVGRGDAPFREPQGESICFGADDGSVYTISEFRGNDRVPLFRYGIARGGPTPPVDESSDPNPTFQARYVHGGDHTHRFTVTNGFQWTLQASTNLRDWTEVDSPFTATPNDDGTTDYVYTRQDQVREFFRFAVTSIDFADYVYESTLAAMENSDPNASDVFLYDSNGDRNPDNFLNSLQGVTGIVAYNNKTQGSGDWYHGCAITPRHLLSCKHARYTVGDQVTFLTSDNVPVTRTITHAEVPPGEQFEVDMVVYLLDSDLPATIKPLEMLGGDTLNYITGDQKIYINDRPFPTVWVNQDEKLGVNEVSTYYMRRFDDPFPNSYEGNQWDHATVGMFTSNPDDGEDNIWSEWRLIGRANDSGSISMIVMGDKLVVNNIMTTPAGGPWFGQLINFNTIKMMIDLVDEKAGIDSGYTVQTPDMSAFNQYSE